MTHFGSALGQECVSYGSTFAKLKEHGILSMTDYMLIGIERELGTGDIYGTPSERRLHIPV